MLAINGPITSMVVDWPPALDAGGGGGGLHPRPLAEHFLTPCLPFDSGGGHRRGCVGGRFAVTVALVGQGGDVAGEVSRSGGERLRHRGVWPCLMGATQ